MPTAAKLVSAVILAITGWFCAELIKPLMEEGRDLSKLSPTFAAVGVVVGWKFLGPRADKNLGRIGSNGFTSALVQTGLTMFVFAFYQMIHQSLRKAYDGPIEAVQSIFLICADFYHDYVTLDLVAVALIGCGIASWCAFRASRKWG